MTPYSSNSSPLTVAQIAEKISAKIVGDGSRKISGIKPLESARSNDLSFFAPTSKRQQKTLYQLAQTTQAGALVVRNFEESFPTTQIVTNNPLAAVIALSQLMIPPYRPSPGVHPQASVDPTAALGHGVSVGCFAVVSENAIIGDNTIIHPHAVIYPNVRIGNNCIIHAGAVLREGITLGSDCVIQNGVVIGGDGFGYILDPIIGHRHIPHIGTVILEDRVDIGANSTIDRATFGETIIKKAAKIDNLVMIAHNVNVGSRTLLCAQVGISGSASVGEDVILGGQVGVADHITIANNVQAAGQSGIIQDLESGARVMGLPAQNIKTFFKAQTILTKLPDLYRKITKLCK